MADEVLTIPLFPCLLFHPQMPLHEYIEGIASTIVYLVLIFSMVLFGYGYFTDEDEASICSRYYDDISARNKELFYWKEGNSCCHYILNEENNIVEECQILKTK